jgi:hypothetical protein
MRHSSAAAAAAAEARAFFVKDGKPSTVVTWRGGNAEFALPTFSFAQVNSEGESVTVLEVQSDSLAPHLILPEDAWYSCEEGDLPATIPRITPVLPDIKPPPTDELYLDNLRMQMHQASQCSRRLCQQIAHMRLKAGSW